ncbi:MAG: endonuclease III [Clostridia bacterium]|nr:endonuclease III [Clostridia bacterium]
MNKKDKVLKIREIFDDLYADADCSLDYKDPFQLLVATQLAAQCTDARVNLVTPALFAKYPDPAAFADADIHTLEELIRSTGFFHNKAKNLKACGEKLMSDFGGIVPDTMDELLTLPGVGRKTANLILGDIFSKPAIVVDTHAGRITKRIGLTKNTDPSKVEFDLKKIVPPEYQTRFCHQLVWHGRSLCTARSPKCDRCPLSGLCNYFIALR